MLLKRMGKKLMLFIFLGLLSIPTISKAAIITVNDLGDTVDADGNCILREAIVSSNDNNDAIGDCISGSGFDVITFDSGLVGTITLQSALPQILEAVTIEGPGAGVLTISGGRDLNDGNPAGVRVFDINIPNGDLVIDVDISGLTISNGFATGGGAIGSGGGIRVGNQDVLNLNESVVTNNTADEGGGIFVNTNGIAIIRNSTISDNETTDGSGGGILASQGTLNISNSTISGNSSMDAGGGIETVLGNLFLSNVTITSNTADSDGSGGAGNGGGILTFGTEGTIENTIIAGNIDESPAAENPDCFNGSVNVVSDGNNIIGIGPCNNFEDGTNGDQVGTTEAPINALLGPLGDNGGPTPTHSLLENSPAIDTGNPDGCFAGGTELDTDQRGFTRPADGNEDGAPICDIGAFEVSCGDTVLQTFAGEQCDDGNNENGDGCSADCQDEDGGPVCGNGDCEDGEDEISCPADCAGVPDCGNGICDAGEDADNCSQDCEEEGDGGCSLATTASSSANYAALALPLLAVGGIWLRRRRSK